MDLISPDGLTEISGLRWQPKDVLQKIPTARLVSKILCESHNALLSPLDSVAGIFFRTIDAIDKNPGSLPPLTQIDGLLFERWFVKVLCGMSAGTGINSGIVPETWKSILLGESWPASWGMYFPKKPGNQILAQELSIIMHERPDNHAVLAATFGVVGVLLHILLGHPDNRHAWGPQRPRGLIFENGAQERRVEFVWPFFTNEAITYRFIGRQGGDLPVVS